MGLLRAAEIEVIYSCVEIILNLCNFLQLQSESHGVLG